VSTATTTIDVAEVRRRHPIDEVVTAAGVELRRSGTGFMGCCPFHDDSTASLSVCGVPDRFHCFGCGASGDVIDFVQRHAGVGFRRAVELLDSDLALPQRTPPQPKRDPLPWPLVSVERGHEINALAWDHFASPVPHAYAASYLRNHRGIDVAPLEDVLGTPVVGHTGGRWTSLVDRLTAHGVSTDELLAMDLAHRSNSGRLVDAWHNRLLVPCRTPYGSISGFIGRVDAGQARVPKYRNPTQTATFQKSKVLYAPIVEPTRDGVTAVVVEGPLDALAVAATAAVAGRLGDFWPCSANGVTVSDTQARLVADSGAYNIVLALDGDEAGAQGTARWIDAVCRRLGHAAMLTRLPAGLDPAEWLAREGRCGLSAFDPASAPAQDPRPFPPGRELVSLALASTHDPVRDTIAAVVPVALGLPSNQLKDLIGQVAMEMASRGLNPNDALGPVLRQAILTEAGAQRDRVPRTCESFGRTPMLAAEAGHAAYRDGLS
jgi:DNA primase